jgi:hypothetical protein
MWRAKMNTGWPHPSGRIGSGAGLTLRDHAGDVLLSSVLLQPCGPVVLVADAVGGSLAVPAAASRGAPSFVSGQWVAATTAAAATKTRASAVTERRGGRASQRLAGLAHSRMSSRGWVSAESFNGVPCSPAGPPACRVSAGSPCWPEICRAVLGICRIDAAGACRPGFPRVAGRPGRRAGDPSRTSVHWHD